jgi:hypothetical protein
MKKLSTLIFVIFAFAISSVTLAQTQNLGDLIDSLWTEITFWYNSNQKVSVQSITNDKIIFQSPIIKNQWSVNITKYTIMYSEYPLTDILEKTDLLNQTKEKWFDLTGSTDPFSMELWTVDNIDPTKKYYIFVIPKDTNWTLGEVSNEIWFKLADKTYWEWNITWSIATTNEVHTAAGADMTLAGITHTINDSQITLKWMPVEWSNNVDILLMDQNTNSFNRLSTVSMGAWSYNFTANRNWEFIFQFIPDNWGRQVNYTVTISWLKWWVTPVNQGWAVINKVPITGPAENILVILIIAAISYLLYKKFYKKAR